MNPTTWFASLDKDKAPISSPEVQYLTSKEGTSNLKALVAHRQQHLRSSQLELLQGSALDFVVRRASGSHWLHLRKSRRDAVTPTRRTV